MDGSEEYSRPIPAERARAQPAPASQLARAKRAFSTRRIEIPDAPRLITGAATPKAGDLLLAHIDAIGHHSRLELISGRRATLHAGDEILATYGDRYAPEQFEALTPADLSACHLVASGGVVSRVVRRGERARSPTKITPIGIVTDASGERLSTRGFALPDLPLASARPPIVAVLGTAMNAGKTITMAALARGETLAGRHVGAAKVTGTGSGRDLWAYLDAGAAEALDFTDAGYATTYRLDPQELERIATTLTAHLVARGAEIVLLELSDGLLLEDTAALVASPVFRDLVDAVVFAAIDSVGAVAGESWLREAGHHVAAITGQLTRSPIMADEATRRAHAPVLRPEDISGGAWLPSDALSGRAVARAV